MRCKGLALSQIWLHEFPRSVIWLAAVTSGIILLRACPSHTLTSSRHYRHSLTMGEQVSFTRFMCCACHARGEGSAFFGTRLAAEVHI